MLQAYIRVKMLIGIRRGDMLRIRMSDILTQASQSAPTRPQTLQVYRARSSGPRRFARRLIWHSLRARSTSRRGSFARNMARVTSTSKLDRPQDGTRCGSASWRSCLRRQRSRSGSLSTTCAGKSVVMRRALSERGSYSATQTAKSPSACIDGSLKLCDRCAEATRQCKFYGTTAILWHKHLLVRVWAPISI